MFSNLKYFIAILIIINIAQQGITQRQELHFGAVFSIGGEASYSGYHLKYHQPLYNKMHYASIGISWTQYFDFQGEVDDVLQLQNDVDMRMIPALVPAYQFTFRRFSTRLELPIGTSIAITKGRLVNEQQNINRTYSITNFLWHTGAGLDLAYEWHPQHKLGIYGFYPFTTDIAWSPPILGVNWTFMFN